MVVTERLVKDPSKFNAVNFSAPVSLFESDR